MPPHERAPRLIKDTQEVPPPLNRSPSPSFFAPHCLNAILESSVDALETTRAPHALTPTSSVFFKYFKPFFHYSDELDEPQLRGPNRFDAPETVPGDALVQPLTWEDAQRALETIFGDTVHLDPNALLAGPYGLLLVAKTLRMFDRGTLSVNVWVTQEDWVRRIAAAVAKQVKASSDRAAPAVSRLPDEIISLILCEARSMGDEATLRSALYVKTSWARVSHRLLHVKVAIDLGHLSHKGWLEPAERRRLGNVCFPTTELTLQGGGKDRDLVCRAISACPTMTTLTLTHIAVPESLFDLPALAGVIHLVLKDVQVTPGTLNVAPAFPRFSLHTLSLSTMTAPLDLLLSFFQASFETLTKLTTDDMLLLHTTLPLIGSHLLDLTLLEYTRCSTILSQTPHLQRLSIILHHFRPTTSFNNFAHIVPPQLPLRELEVHAPGGTKEEMISLLGIMTEWIKEPAFDRLEKLKVPNLPVKLSTRLVEVFGDLTLAAAERGVEVEW